jgi:hypothetical protein
VALGEFAVKVNDIIKEGWGTVASNLAKSAVGLKSDEPWRQPRPQQVAKPSSTEIELDSSEVVDPIETPAVASSWVTTSDGVLIKPATATSPTFAKYNKQIYRLDNEDRWVDIRDKPVTQTMVAVLNQALEQI